MAGMRGDLVSEYFAETVLWKAFEGQLGEETRAAAWHRFAQLWAGIERDLGPATSVRTVFDRAAAPLAHLLGFELRHFQASRSGREIAATLGANGMSIGLVVTEWGANLDGAWREAVHHGIAIDAGWSLCCNGRQLRLMDASRSYARSHLEFDLAVAASDERTFAILWALLRADVFTSPDLARPPDQHDRHPRTGGPGSESRAGVPSWIDRILEASSKHTVGVCRGLRHGVVEALVALLQGIVSARDRGSGDRRGPNLRAVYGETLIVVYRILFLLFAEARGLVPLWHPVYRDSYSMETLRDTAEGPGPHRGIWETLLAISRLAHAGCDAGTLQVTPFNGRLFAPARTALAEAAAVDDEAASRALVALSTDRRARGRRLARVDYRDLGVEQLGAVYETVLDYDPVVEVAAPDRAVRLETGSGRRKASGTFYTPTSVTDYLVRRTLYPLVARASADDILRLRVVDPAMGSGAFLVAACRYLAAAYESALVAEGRCQAGDLDAAERASFRRLVAERCLFGVDLNPMAVELARLSIWLTTLASDRPLTFLDHHLVTGDSLVGAAPADLLGRPPGGARRGRPGEGSLPLFEPGDLEHDLRSVIPARLRLAREPADTLEAVRDKERALADLDRPSAAHGRWKRALDLWCAAWFWPDQDVRPDPRTFAALVDETLGRPPVLPDRTSAAWLRSAESIAASRHFFHWPLEFPEVFFADDGTPATNAGFDAVLTNPPWDMLRADRGRADMDGRAARALVGFARGSGLYRSQSTGHPNRFQLFAERVVRLSARGARLGMVLPWGLAADQGCAPLRRLLFDRCEVDAIVGMENTNAVFPIHRSVRFLLLTATTGGSTERLRCRFGEAAPHRLDAVPSAGGDARHFPVVLRRSFLKRFSGPDLAIPDIRGVADLALVEKVLASCPPIGSADGWNVRFGRELNATDDRQHFVEAAGGVPIVEGKQLRPFVVDVGASRLFVPPSKARTLVDVDFTYGRSRLGYREVASATNRLTLIAAIIPAGCLTTHTVFCLKTPLGGATQAYLCGVFNSFVANYLVRLRVVTHVGAGIIERLPVPVLDRGSRTFRQIAALAARLQEQPGGPGWELRYARLQALVARLYGLSIDDLTHLLDTFPLVDPAVKERVRETYRLMTPV